MKTRVELLDILRRYHPAQIMDINPLMAHYTGGMKDDGDINWQYCLFEATKEELEYCVSNLVGHRING
jgi:hypothetical protein